MAPAKIAEIVSRLILGLDFGTSYSSIAYALHEWNPRQQPSVTAFNETNIQSVQFDFVASQVKTQIAWHAANRVFIWGDEVDVRIRDKEIPENDRIVMMKLGLEKSAATEKIRAKQAEQLSRIPPACWGGKGEPRHPVIEDVISIYLGLLMNYAKYKIIKSFGVLAKGDIFDITDVQCAICVPALWTPEMNQIMVTAAEKAGLPNPDIVSESEAAASFIMHEQQKQAAASNRRALGPSGSIMPHVSHAHQGLLSSMRKLTSKVW